MELFDSGRNKDALSLFNKYKKLIDAIFLETNPIGIKHAMNFLSMNNDELRLPLSKFSITNQEILEKEILKVGKYFNSKI